MKTLKDNAKTVLCDLVSNGKSWEEAYEKLVGVFRKNADELYERAEELSNELKKNGETDAYINLRLDAFRLAYDREILCLHTINSLKAEGYEG